jgi:hypothetical protein
MFFGKPLRKAPFLLVSFDIARYRWALNQEALLVSRKKEVTPDRILKKI